MGNSKISHGKIKMPRRKFSNKNLERIKNKTLTKDARKIKYQFDATKKLIEFKWSSQKWRKFALQDIHERK